MATDTRNLIAHFDTDADFRTWGSGVNAQLAAVGLIQTTNTGQINWATVLRPAANSFAGYEIWRFNDALQATKPVFIKLEYGSFTTLSPALRLTVSTATDGAGTLTGQVGATAQITGGNKASGVTLPSYCSGSPSRLSLWTNVDAVTSGFALGVMVERTKTAVGVDTGDGIVFKAASRYQVIPFTGTIPAVVTVNQAAALAGGVSAVGSNVALSPTIAALGKIFFAFWAAYMQADLPTLVPFQADHLGATRTMLPLGTALASGALVQGDNTGHSLAFLWE